MPPSSPPTASAMPAIAPGPPGRVRRAGRAASAADADVDPRDGAHVVVAGVQAPDAVRALGRRSARAGRHQLAFALRVLVAHHADHRAGHRIAVFVEDVAGDDAAARQAEVDAVQLLAVGELQRRARLQRPALAVREADEAGLRHRQRVAAGRQFRELERPVVVGQHAAAARQLGGVDEHARALDRTAVVGREHAAADRPAWTGAVVCAGVSRAGGCGPSRPLLARLRAAGLRRLRGRRRRTDRDRHNDGKPSTHRHRPPV